MSFVEIFALGGGGGGGNGVVGAASNAAGGGGGGSAAQTSARFLAAFFPDTLTLQVGTGGLVNGAGNNTDIFIGSDDTNANGRLIRAVGGGAGGNAAGATAGTAGTGGVASASTNHPLMLMGIGNSLAGQNGNSGGTTTNGNSVTIPTTGLVVTGGTGGGGLPPAATAGRIAGTINGAGAFPTVVGTPGASSATDPAGHGSSGFQPIPNLPYFYGGVGGGSTHGSATGAGLVGGNGGAGHFGSGGGGGGGALTGSTQGLGGRGGDGIVIIVSW